jgi:hypothetical protein
MKKLLGLLTITLFLGACRAGDEVSALDAVDDKTLAWTFIQLNVPEEDGGSETYFLYGQISKPLLGQIAENRIKQGFLFLRNVRYWDSDNIIRAYRDGENSGDLIYRIEDIRRIKFVRTEPQIGMGYEQFEAQEKKSEQPPAATPPAKPDAGPGNTL